eukprot:gene42100-40425_t
MPAVCSRLRPDAVLLAFLLDLEEFHRWGLDLEDTEDSGHCEDGWRAMVGLMVGSGSIDEDGFAIAAAFAAAAQPAVVVAAKAAFGALRAPTPRNAG